jgi:hypothetical protein
MELGSQPAFSFAALVVRFVEKPPLPSNAAAAFFVSCR